MKLIGNTLDSKGEFMQIYECDKCGQRTAFENEHRCNKCEICGEENRPDKTIKIKGDHKRKLVCNECFKSWNKMVVCP